MLVSRDFTVFGVWRRKIGLDFWTNPGCGLLVHVVWRIVRFARFADCANVTLRLEGFEQISPYKDLCIQTACYYG
jgi:hypothetical protein